MLYSSSLLLWRAVQVFPLLAVRDTEGIQDYSPPRYDYHLFYLRESSRLGSLLLEQTARLAGCSAAG